MPAQFPSRATASVCVGLGVPALAILVVMPLIARSNVSVLGIPLVFYWLFLWFPLTTLCLWISRNVIERNGTGTGPAPAKAGDEAS
ncbi:MULTISPECIES: DUF3311 domain-containing protein [unclassified Streptomyces]|uniref:DUF3311 domain-containing protein n=1 Tax=unclassified Streptomyces TaxID=2593676 RepID=UPI002E18E577|nr:MULTISPECIES: DUF3311 domain-containing protein [unclassified Streptomyces]